METYSGRLACDGEGNLLADESKTVGYRTVIAHDENGNEIVDDATGTALEISVPIVKVGPNHGRHVAFDEGQYIFVDDGEPSHNKRHEKNVVTMAGTLSDDDATDEERERAATNQPHHDQVQEDDPHYDPDAPNLTKLKFDSDRVAAKVTGHTDAYTGAFDE